MKVMVISSNYFLAATSIIERKLFLNNKIEGIEGTQMQAAKLKNAEFPLRTTLEAYQQCRYLLFIRKGAFLFPQLFTLTPFKLL
jgi:hypothetical protein